jgi:hypothetical protein
LGIRPDAFEDAEFASADLPRVEVEISVLEELGAEANVIFPIDAPPVDVEDVRTAAQSEGEAELFGADRRARFVARIDPRTRGRAGSRLTLTVDPSQFYFFDRETGESLTASASAMAGA